jgi:hypothetical protein
MSQHQDKQYMEDHRGSLVPVEKIKPIDLLRDDLVKRIVEKSRSTSAVLKNFKSGAMDEIAAFVEQSALEYGVHYGGVKGNIQLLSYDGRYKVLKSIAEHIVFDERLQIAKQLIDKCISTWTVGSSGNIIALINHAFEVDKQGKINTESILRLRRLNIADSDWKKAMDAISDSIQVTGSKDYIRVYERKDDGTYAQVPLDLSAV